MTDKSEKIDFRDLFSRFKPKVPDKQIEQETTSSNNVLTQVQNINSDKSDLKNEIIKEYKNLDLKIEVIDLINIEHYIDVPDYQEATSIDKPLIMESGGKFSCVEGWSIIEAANTDSKSTIECRIYHVQNHFDIMMALKKTTIRSLTEGGFASYSEMVRNISICIRKLLNESDQLCKYTHGGDHKSAEFKNDEYINVKEILKLIYSKRAKSTLDNYVTHGEHLSITVMNYFVDQEATAEFYAAFQPHKTDYVKRLQEQNKTLMEIQDKVSEKAKEKFAEFKLTEIITPFEDDVIRTTIAEYVKQQTPFINTIVPKVNLHTPAKSTPGAFDPYKTIDEVINHLTAYKQQQIPIEQLIENIKSEIELLQNIIVESYAAINSSQKKEDGQDG